MRTPEGQVKHAKAEGAPDMLAALTLIAEIAEGSTTANSLPNIAKIARAALAKAEGVAAFCPHCNGPGMRLDQGCNGGCKAGAPAEQPKAG